MHSFRPMSSSAEVFSASVRSRYPHLRRLLVIGRLRREHARKCSSGHLRREVHHTRELPTVPPCLRNVYPHVSGVSYRRGLRAGRHVPARPDMRVARDDDQDIGPARPDAGEDNQNAQSLLRRRRRPDVRRRLANCWRRARFSSARSARAGTEGRTQSRMLVHRDAELAAGQNIACRCELQLGGDRPPEYLAREVLDHRVDIRPRTVEQLQDRDVDVPVLVHGTHCDVSRSVCLFRLGPTTAVAFVTSISPSSLL
jgi:hypothetical protein